jgi:hypothetical protein
VLGKRRRPVRTVAIGGSTVLQCPDLPRETAVVFRDLYTASVTLGSAADVCTAVTFNLDAEGHLEVGFDYEDRPIEDQHERVTRWWKTIEDTLS